MSVSLGSSRVLAQAPMTSTKRPASAGPPRRGRHQRLDQINAEEEAEAHMNLINVGGVMMVCWWCGGRNNVNKVCLQNAFLHIK